MTYRGRPEFLTNLDTLDELLGAFLTDADGDNLWRRGSDEEDPDLPPVYTRIPTGMLCARRRLQPAGLDDIPR